MTSAASSWPTSAIGDRGIRRWLRPGLNTPPTVRRHARRRPLGDLGRGHGRQDRAPPATGGRRESVVAGQACPQSDPMRCRRSLDVRRRLQSGPVRGRGRRWPGKHPSPATALMRDIRTSPGCSPARTATGCPVLARSRSRRGTPRRRRPEGCCSASRPRGRCLRCGCGPGCRPVRRPSGRPRRG
jgi:hypothetical protein